LEKAAAKIRDTVFRPAGRDRGSRTRLQPVSTDSHNSEAALRLRADQGRPYRCPHPLPKLTDAFVDELKFRCAVMSEDEKRAWCSNSSLRTCRQGLDAAVAEKAGRNWCGSLERLWDKYALSLRMLHSERERITTCLKD